MDCVIYAVGSSYVSDVLEVLRRLGWNIRGGVSNIQDGYEPPGLTPLAPSDGIPNEWLEHAAVLGLFTPGHRAAVEAEARRRGFRSFPAVVDSSALLSSAEIGEGTVVNAGVTIGALTKLHRFVALNRSASIGHHVVAEDYASVGPAGVLCGHVRLERGAFVGAGAVVGPEVRVGANAVVAAGAVVMRDVPDHALVAGNPARIVKTGIPGYNGVGVASPPVL